MNSKEVKSSPWDWVKNLPFKPGDQNEFIKYGVAGFLALGSYHLGTKLVARSINEVNDLEDADIADDLGGDPVVLQALVSLQAYRFKNPLLFRRCIESLNDLIFYEKQLLSEQIIPTSEDKLRTVHYFRKAAAYLNQFQMFIREDMGVTHGKAANIYVKTILESTESHFHNCLQACSQFDPHKLMGKIQQDALKEKQAYEEKMKISVRNESRAYEQGKYRSPYLDDSRKQMEKYAPHSTARKHKRLFRHKRN